MDIFCFLKPTNEVDPLEAALVADSPEEMQRASMVLEAPFIEIKKWVTEAVHGMVISSFGRELCIKIPMDSIEELNIKINKFDPIKISAGIGHTPGEAFEALKMAIAKDTKLVLFKAEDLEKGWPKDEAENQANTYNDKVLRDSYAEEGMGSKLATIDEKKVPKKQHIFGKTPINSLTELKGSPVLNSKKYTGQIGTAGQPLDTTSIKQTPSKMDREATFRTVSAVVENRNSQPINDLNENDWHTVEDQSHNKAHPIPSLSVEDSGIRNIPENYYHIGSDRDVVFSWHMTNNHPADKSDPRSISASTAFRAAPEGASDFVKNKRHFGHFEINNGKVKQINGIDSPNIVAHLQRHIDANPGLSKAEGDAPAQPSQPPQSGQTQDERPKKSAKEKIIETLLMVKQHSQDILKLKEINPKAYEAIKKIIDAMLAMAKDPSIQKNEEKVEQEMSEPPESSKELHKKITELSKANPFEDIQQKMAKVSSRIQELASTTKGSAWKHANGFAVVGLDPHDQNRQNWRVSLLDHDGQPVGHSIHPSHVAALHTLSDHKINVLDKPHQTMSKSEEAMEFMGLSKTSVIGTVKDGRMKVQERDEVTRAVKGTHWHRLLDGMAMGPNGHAVSPDKAGKKE